MRVVNQFSYQTSIQFEKQSKVDEIKFLRELDHSLHETIDQSLNFLD